MYASSIVSFRRTDLTVLSMSCPAASRSEAEPLKTAVVNVFSVLSISIFVASIFTL